MAYTVFFSWQADTENREGRSLIEKALERAVRAIGQDVKVDPAMRDLAVDRDTRGVGGQPPIVETIFRKIDKAAVFVPDLTFTGSRLDGRPTPNPNVLIEYGWALKARTYSRVIPVMNTAFGEPSEISMPFNMRHLRRPITYDCPHNLGEDARKQVRAQLAKDLEHALRLVFESDDFRDSLPKPPEPARYVERIPVDGRGRFKAIGEAVGLARDFIEAPRQITLAPDPLCWLRLTPTADPGGTWSVSKLEIAMNSPTVPFLNTGWHGANFLRSREGYGAYLSLPETPDVACTLVFGFTAGEIWSIDAYWLQKRDGRAFVPEVDGSFRQALVAYGKLLLKLGIKPPYKWIAGMENLKGRILYIPTRPGFQRFRSSHDGECLEDVVTESGLYSPPGDVPGPTLKRFFVKLYESCGVLRQEWQDAP